MESLPPIWYQSLHLMTWVCTIPFGIFAKYVYSRLTLQPFVWYPTYTMELGVLACFAYNYYYHWLWVPRINIGMGLTPNPSPDLMYIHEY